MPDRCTCRECRTGDALPDRLQGWPGAWQMLLLAPVCLEGRPEVTTNDDALRDACRERCAEEGDCPCYELEGTGSVDEPFVWSPCQECLDEVNGPQPEPLDPAAVVRALL